jgi:hypothetical protein
MTTSGIPCRNGARWQVLKVFRVSTAALKVTRKDSQAALQPFPDVFGKLHEVTRFLQI